MHWLTDPITRHFRIAFIGSLAAILALAWFNRFVSDDGYIVFRYAGHLVQGQGLTYNPGERVEGYTCFLFVILVAAGMRVGLDPILASYLIGILSAAGTLIATYGLTRHLSGSRLVGLVAMILLGTNYSFSAWSTGGLETQLHACLIAAFWALVAGEILDGSARLPRLAACSVFSALAVMTRPDTVVLVAPITSVLLFRLLAAHRPASSKALAFAALVIPFALLIGPWLAWKLDYYGSLLPNTFHAKAGARMHLGRGVRFVYRFVTEYWLGAILIFSMWFWRDVLRPRLVAFGLVVTLGLWTMYLVVVGGDFMEFRMFVPVLPLLAWVLAETARQMERRAGLGLAFAILVVTASVQHAFVFSRTPHVDMIQHAHALDPRKDPAMENWVEVGQVLGRSFQGRNPPTIAVFAAGVVPYYSDLPTIDMVGLNDRWVALHGDLWSPAPGHERLATMDYLIERRVHLLINNPRIAPMPVPDVVDVDPTNMPRFAAGQAAGKRLPDGTRMLAIPVTRERALLALYIHPSADLDRAIADYGWKVHPIRITLPNQPHRTAAPGAPAGPGVWKTP